MTHVIRRFLVGLATGLLALGGCIVAVNGTGGGQPAAAAPAPPCGTGQPKAYQHVVWILMENKSYSDIVGNPSAPYINNLMNQCAHAQVQHTVHPSLPNYIELTSGGTQGVTDDLPPAAHPLSAASIFSQLNGNWRSFAESMPHACTLTNSGKYAPRHVPATYYTNIRSLCKTHVLPYSAVPKLNSKFTMITPNLVHDMHNGTSVTQEIKTGDTYLATFLPKLFATTAYTSGLTEVIVTWDEGNATSNVVPAIFISPSIGPNTDLGTMTDVDLLHNTESTLGLPALP
jgi:hypothetical protein